MRKSNTLSKLRRAEHLPSLGLLLILFSVPFLEAPYEVNADNVRFPPPILKQQIEEPIYSYHPPIPGETFHPQDYKNYTESRSQTAQILDTVAPGFLAQDYEKDRRQQLKKEYDRRYNDESIRGRYVLAGTQFPCSGIYIVLADEHGSEITKMRVTDSGEFGFFVDPKKSTSLKRTPVMFIFCRNLPDFLEQEALLSYSSFRGNRT